MKIFCMNSTGISATLFCLFKQHYRTLGLLQRAACSGVWKETEVLVTAVMLMVCYLCQESAASLQVLEADYIKYKTGLTPSDADRKILD